VYLYDHRAVSLTPLGIIDQEPGSHHPRGISDAAVVVGQCWCRAFLYENGTIIDLNTRIDPSSGMELVSAYDIDDHGNIVCGGLANGHGTATLLLSNQAQPIPAPGSLILLALGTTLVGRLRTRGTL